MSYNPYNRFCFRWWRYWLDFPSDSRKFLKRVWDYRGILWDDNDYDFATTLHMMRFKLKRLQDHMADHGNLTHTEDYVVELAKVDVLLRNVMDDDPDDEWLAHYNQWHIGLSLEKDCKKELEHKKVLRLSYERGERNWHALWRYLDKNMRNWWD